MKPEFDVVGLAAGAVLAEPWRVSERSPDAVIASEHPAACSRLWRIHRPGGDDLQIADWTMRDKEEEWYGGHFICESVGGAYVHLITGAPLMRAVVDRIALLDERSLSPVGAREVLGVVIAMCRAAQVLGDHGKAVRALPAVRP